jgi:hypothetical protein
MTWKIPDNGVEGTKITGQPKTWLATVSEEGHVDRLEHGQLGLRRDAFRVHVHRGAYRQLFHF